MQQQLSTSAAPATITVGEFDSRLRLAACARRDIQLAPGARLIGNTHVRVRCVEGASWAINLPVQINQNVSYYVAARPLPAGQVLSAADIQLQQGNLGQLPGSIVLDPSQALGRTLGTALASGALLRAEMLRAAIVIRQGQRVKLTVRMNGIDVSNEGAALNNATEGQLVRVRLLGNQIVQGTAMADGSVNATP
ncbi:hypothetical protein JHS3_10140 [Jeongeupia sp. HS-3]|nr:flagellar basal body P-ring formation chaperone FlgA [Jeongeupia sp. HS-3]BCL75278.1 hypothetical protein JHS3_10140 [Jeongeupia sp. HS-3]